MPCSTTDRLRVVSRHLGLAHSGGRARARVQAACAGGGSAAQLNHQIFLATVPQVRKQCRAEPEPLCARARANARAANLKSCRLPHSLLA